MPPIDPCFALANRIEAGVWFVIALALAAVAVRRPAWRRDAGIAACVLVGFGASDLVEARTGAWWRPWWLLAWKGVSVLVLVGLAWRAWRT